MRKNIDSMLGSNPMMWCCPTVPQGNGLKYPLAQGDGEWMELARRDPRLDTRVDMLDMARDGYAYEP